jgi:hypothetical protein
LSALKARLDAVRARDGDGDGDGATKAPAAKKAPAQKTPSKR